MNILVTGAAGFIGTHTLVTLLEAGHEVVAIDNFVNSKPEALNRVREITKKVFPHHSFDVRQRTELRSVFASKPIEAVIHFAGLKSVGESVQRPLEYYNNNLVSTIALLETMAEYNCRNLVFSSSATVYGECPKLPISEDSRLSATNPYGRTKLIIEDILRDIASADSRWKIALLRYFNPVGAHPSGRIGEDPNGIPNNLFPYIAQVAIGRLSELKIFGGDYPTSDGTGVRDYIHVCDLAEGHLCAVEHLESLNGAESINLGTGRGHSVLEVIRAFEQVSAKALPFKIVARRPGDVASCYADCGLASKRIGWTATRTIFDACRDHWRWQSANPEGFC